MNGVIIKFQDIHLVLGTFQCNVKIYCRNQVGIAETTFIYQKMFALEFKLLAPNGTLKPVPFFLKKCCSHSPWY